MSSSQQGFSRTTALLDRFAVAIALAGVLVFWELAVDFFEIPRYVLPAPTDIAMVINKYWWALLAHSWVTLLETLAGFGLSVCIGIPLAFIIVYSRIFERVLYPILVASQAVPKVALAPILLIALGYSLLPKVIVAFLIAFFPVVVNTVTGLASVDRDTLNLMHSMGASKLDIFLKVRFPQAVPSMIGGFKVAVALAVVGAVVGEFVGSRSGLGYYMLVATGNFDTPLVFACVFFLTIMGITLFYTVGLLEMALARFNRTARLARAAEPAGQFGM